MKTTKLLTVKSVTSTTEEGLPLVDKNGMRYNKIVFESASEEQVIDPLTGEIAIVAVKPETGTKIFYEQSYLDNQKQFGFDFKVGQRVAGDIVRRTVAPYYIDEKEVTTYKCVVLGITSDVNFETAVKQAFKDAGHIIVQPEVVSSHNILA